MYALVEFEVHVYSGHKIYSYIIVETELNNYMDVF